MIEKRFLKICEICEYLSIGKSTAYRLVYAKKLPVAKVGTSIRVDKRLLDKLLSEQQATRKKGIQDD